MTPAARRSPRSSFGMVSRAGGPGSAAASDPGAPGPATDPGALLAPGGRNPDPPLAPPTRAGRSGPRLADHAGPLLRDDVLRRGLLRLGRERDVAGRGERQGLVGGLVDSSVIH